jgi:hypothetical protein
MRTKQHLMRLLAFVVLVAVLANWARADTMALQVAPNGSGSVNGQPIPWMIGPDPGPGGLPNALFYGVGPAFNQWTTGDILLLDSAGALRHLVRLTCLSNGAPILVFYSRQGEGTLASIGFPGIIQPPAIALTEAGQGAGQQGYVWTPTSEYSPGYVPGAQVQYNFINHAPEPSSLAALAGLGGTGIAAWLWRRRR